MIPTAEIQERQFRDIGALDEFLSSQEREDYEALSNRIQLSDDGTLGAPGFEGPLTSVAWQGLLEVLSIPADFASRVCPPDLAARMINRLLHEAEKRIRIRTVNGVARGIMPHDRLPIEHTLLAEWVPEQSRRCEVTVGAAGLRITFTREDVEVLPDDVYGQGWEIISDENGLGGAEAQGYVRRLVCQNGMVGLRSTASFRRGKASNDPVLGDLASLREKVEDDWKWDLETAARWASQNQVEDHRDEVVNYLSRSLEGDITRTLLDNVGEESTWYDLLNTVTAEGQSRPLLTRRQYEMAGGELLQWFRSRGQDPRPWEDARCVGCQFLENPAETD